MHCRANGCGQLSSPTAFGNRKEVRLELLVCAATLYLLAKHGGTVIIHHVANAEQKLARLVSNTLPIDWTICWVNSPVSPVFLLSPIYRKQLDSFTLRCKPYQSVRTHLAHVALTSVTVHIIIS